MSKKAEPFAVKYPHTTGLLRCCFIVAIIVGVMAIYKINKRIYPNGNEQELVTMCYLTERLRDYQRYNSDAGYIYVDGERKSVDKLDETKTEIKVEYTTKCAISSYCTGHTSNKWIPKKDFYPYYTLRELSEIANKTYKK